MLTFEDPLLLGFSLLPIIVSFYLVVLRRRGGGRLAFSHTIWGGEAFSPKMNYLQICSGIATFFFFGGVVVLALAIGGPLISKSEEVHLSRGVDAMIVLDQSPSMSAQDVSSSNRFEAAKEVVKKFIQGRETDSIGLVGFGQKAALRAPKTVDYDTLLERLDQMQVGEMGEGTAIGMGIATAAYHMSSHTDEEKILILITDGGNNAGEIAPLDAARIAQDLGIRIYTIGIHNRTAAPIEFTNPETGKTVVGTLHGRFDEESLRTIAVHTGGRFFQAGSGGTLGTIFREIDSLEVTRSRVRIRVVNVPLYRWFILTGLAMVWMAILIRKGLLKEIL